MHAQVVRNSEPELNAVMTSNSTRDSFFSPSSEHHSEMRRRYRMFWLTPLRDPRFITLKLNQ